MMFDIDELSKKHPAIRVSGLRKTFRKRVAGVGGRGRGKWKGRRKESREITAVDGVSLSVERGTIFALLGPNSCGKSTTMRCMGTLSRPDAGSVQYFGVDADAHGGAVARHMFGFVMQSNGLDKTLTGREHLRLFAGLAHLDHDEAERVIDEVVSLLDLGAFIDRVASVYSGGVVRRLDVAIALLHQPPILILDEPTTGLDVESRAVIWRTLAHWRDHGGTVFLSSHYLEEVDALADRLAIMDRGVVIAQGSPHELKSRLGGLRLTVRIHEFTPPDVAERALAHVAAALGPALVSGVVNTARANALELVVNPHHHPHDANTDADANGNANGNANGHPGQKSLDDLAALTVDALRQVGHDNLFAVARAQPSLDDVYLAATGQSIADADALAKTQRTEKSLRKESMT